jgi:hypothetical protein
VTKLGERLEVSSRPAAEIEDRERRFALDGSQQRFDVLADVVIARTFPEILGMPVVVLQRETGDLFQVLRGQLSKKAYSTRLTGTRCLIARSCWTRGQASLRVVLRIGVKEPTNHPLILRVVPARFILVGRAAHEGRLERRPAGGAGRTPSGRPYCVLSTGLPLSGRTGRLLKWNPW